ncbi:MAG TPA: LysR family transcriptional regulator [Caulobacteraceae bacterium]|nr:LysR family transcriptional regulator [Caulobacteraceae bacterium]
MSGATLQQLRCFDAVVTEGGFQAAAAKLGRSHPSVFAAVRNLEQQLGLTLLDRDSYRVALTAAGRSFHERARILLGDAERLGAHAAQLRAGEETELTVVVGDLCPLAPTLGLLRRFFDERPSTRLHLHFEALAGPMERLRDGEADLILHHVDMADPEIERLPLVAVELEPVVAPGFLAFPITRHITPRQMRDYVQCVIRDSARHTTGPDYHLIEGARSWTVSDQLMKKELILQGMGWGNLPTFLIEAERADGRLVSIRGEHFRGGRAHLVAARLRSRPAGPVAERLWRHIGEESRAGRGLRVEESSRLN